MPAELKTGVVRIVSNYARLLSTLVLGLAVVPLLLWWLGDEAFGIISLLGASVGIAALFRDLTHRSMIRELGASYHSGDPQRFLTTYNSAFLLSAAVAALTAASFLVLLAIFPVFKISPELREPARWFLIWQGTHAVLIVVLSPVFNMYLVQHRFLFYNSWYVLLRAGNLIAAALLAFILGIPGEPQSLAVYGFAWAMLDNAILVAAVLVLLAKDRRLLIRPRHMHRAALRPLLGTFGWNTGVQLSMASIERLPAFILNIMIGPIANTIWGIVYRLTSYVRMATIGVQFGADSVSARMSAAGDAAAAERVRSFMATQTRLNATVALPVGLALFALAKPALDVWVGGRVENPDAILPPAILMTRILAVAIATRAVSEGWVVVLYGAGHVARYAPVIFAGGVLAPLLGIVLVWTLPEQHKVQGPALGFAIVVSSVYLLALPVVGARCVGQTYLQVLAPMSRPLLAATITAPVLWVGHLFPLQLGHGPIGQLLVPGATFGLLYGALAAAFVFSPRERERIKALVFRRGIARPSSGAAAEP